MGGPDLITLGGDTEAPLSHFRSALLATALLLPALVVLPTLGLQPPTHALRIDLIVDSYAAAAPWPRHRLDVTADGRAILDGRPVADLIELRMRLDTITIESEPGLELRPDAEARHEDFMEVLGVIRRSSMPNLRVLAEGAVFPIPCAGPIFSPGSEGAVCRDQALPRLRRVARPLLVARRCARWLEAAGDLCARSPKGHKVKPFRGGRERWAAATVRAMPDSAEEEEAMASPWFPELQDGEIYKVVVNADGMYSIWPAETWAPAPPGWTDVGFEGLKPQVLDYIVKLWAAKHPEDPDGTGGAHVEEA